MGAIKVRARQAGLDARTDKQLRILRRIKNMNNKIYGCFALSLLLFVLVSVSLHAQTSQLIPISGSVSVADGTYNLTFRLFDAASMGNYLGYTDVQNSFNVVDGV